MSEFRVPKKIKKSKRKTILHPFIKYSFVFLLACFFAGIAALKLYLGSLPPIENLGEFKPNIVTKFYSHDGEVIKTFTIYTFSKVDLDQIPDILKEAIISTEDKNFYKHDGYDLTGLARSMVANIMAGRVVQGASTITQQLSRILFLNNEKTFNRKLKEFIIAARIEKTISKDKILEMYLNNVYLGSGAYGVEGASQIYFNKHVNELTLSEAALIAGLPQAPSVYSPYNDIKKAEKRRNQVLNRMYKMRYITKKEFNEAKNEKIKLSTMPRLYTLNKAPYFCDFAMNELEKLGFDETDISQGGYKVITTLDYNAQQKANEAIINNMNAYGLKGSKQQVALFAYSPINGRIIAYAGGKDYTKSQYDRVTQAIRPPGSAFKPFVYATALEKGVTPNDMIEDLPVKIGNWAPRNYGNKYRGKIPIYTALMVSSNVCAARLIEYVGIRPVIQMTRVLGITTPIEYDYTIALGSNGVKLYELTRAYGAFANGGYKVEPYAIERVETSRGKVVYQAPKPKANKVLNIKTAAEMTAMLKTVVKSGTGRAADIGKPVAAKTGTTDNYKDAYFLGYTPDIVAGVWVGNDDNSQLGSLTGGTVPALIWRDVMKVATEPYGNSDFNYPAVHLKSFKAGASKIITSDEAQKAFEQKEKDKEKEKNKQEELPQMSPEKLLENNPAAKMPKLKSGNHKPADSKIQKPEANLAPNFKSEPPQPDLAPVPVPGTATSD